MASLIYPSLQAPVLTQSQQAEQVTESRWHQPLADPVRRRGIAVAIIASSGCSFDPYPIPPVIPTIDKTLIAWSEPVRLPKRLVTGAQQAMAFAPAAPFEEAVLYSKWAFQWSDPVRRPPSVFPHAQQSEARGYPGPFEEAVLYSKWGYQWSEPVRLKPGLGAPYQQTNALVWVPPLTPYPGRTLANARVRVRFLGYRVTTLS